MSQATQNISTSMMNARILEQLQRGNTKVAEDAATDYIRTHIREDSFAFKILPSLLLIKSVFIAF